MLLVQKDSPLYAKLKEVAASYTFTLSLVTAAALSGAFLPVLLPHAWAGHSQIRSAILLLSPLTVHPLTNISH